MLHAFSCGISVTRPSSYWQIRTAASLSSSLCPRLTGTNEAEAVKILDSIGIPALKDMDEAVSKVVKLVKEAA